MDEVRDVSLTSSSKDSKQAIPQARFGLVTLNHFGISVRDLDRSIMFYRALTGQEPAATGTWSSTALDKATGVEGRGNDGGGGSSDSRKAAIGWATFHINNVNIDLIQIKNEDDSDLSLEKHSLGELGTMHACFEVEDLEPVFKRMQEAGIQFHGPFHRISRSEDGANEGIGTVVASFDGPDGERLELIAPQGPFMRMERMTK
jgi:catechol 2,3-dioxygenase-like lactoylglutathione lyase family enzyme